MNEKTCGKCRYFGEPLGTFHETREFHRCNCEKSIFKECLATATGCEKYERKRRRGERMSKLEKAREEIEEKEKNTIDWSRSVGLIDALEIIDKYAEQEPKWIPVSEGLPKGNIPCLITILNSDIIKPCNEIYPIISIYDEYTETWIDDNSEDIPYDVIAWMPLPEPFEPKPARWIDDKCSVCGKGIEDLIDSREWYRNKRPNFCPFCGVRIVKESEE